jgi:hypothetical protein
MEDLPDSKDGQQFTSSPVGQTSFGLVISFVLENA